MSGDIAWAASEMDARMQPVALLVPPKVVAAGHAAHGTAAAAAARLPALAAPVERLVPSLSRRAAMEVARKQLGDEPLVHAHGYICRESYSLGDRPQNFYMIGSMGLASAIGLGLARARSSAASSSTRPGRSCAPSALRAAGCAAVEEAVFVGGDVGGDLRGP